MSPEEIVDFVTNTDITLNLTEVLRVLVFWRQKWACRELLKMAKPYVQLIKEACPDLSVHASTQMTLTSAECIEVARELGIERVVLPRELSLDEIGAIHAACDMELEAFVHGALCVGECVGRLG